MADIVTQIASVTRKPVTPRGGGDPIDIYIVSDTAGTEYSTRDRSLAEVANGLIGSQAVIEYDEKRNGRFVNRYINNIGSSGSGPISGTTIAGPPVAQPLPPAQAQPVGQQQPAQSIPVFTGTPYDPREQNIAKAVALKAAVDVIQYLPEASRTIPQVMSAAEFFTDWLIHYTPSQPAPVAPAEDDIPF